MVFKFIDRLRSKQPATPAPANQVKKPVASASANPASANPASAKPASAKPTQSTPHANLDHFSDLGLAPALVQAVEAEGYKSPTPIQQQAIPPILEGMDLLGCAQTGTGKTAAFALPILQRLSSNAKSPRMIRSLILAPTRELAIQINDSFKVYGKFSSLRSAVVFGGVGLEPQIRTVRAGVDILVATPGRLLDLVNRGVIKFTNIEILVLDEADRMLDMGFVHDIKKILKLLPNKRQNLLFSATIPKEVQGLIDSILVKPVKVEVTPASTTSERVSQQLFYVARPDKKNLILEILRDQSVTRALVFTRTKYNANKLESWLNQNGISAAAIHGNKSQNARQRALENFRTGDIRILVASDIAARGIDIDDISHVINFEIPNEPETYVHRIGRTGRALAHGKALSLCDHEEIPLIKQIERTTKTRIPVVSDHAYTANAPNPNQASNGPGQQPASHRPNSGARHGRSRRPRPRQS